MERRVRAVWVAVLAASVALPAAALAKPKAKPKEAQLTPTASIPLRSIGASMPAALLVQSGISALTVNLIDNTHLLVTWATHALVPREANDPETDTDRILGAEVVEIPSGHVLSKTTWQAHDLARYLWPLGHGQFMVRLGKQLSIMNPGQDPGSPLALERASFQHAPGTPVAVVPELQGTLFALIVENPPDQHTGANVTFGDQSTNAERPTYTVQYFRKPANPGAPWAETGRLRADMPLVMPMDADGYLWSTEDARMHGRWNVVFHSFEGKVTPVGPVDSTCVPRLTMVSRSEFLAMTCATTSESQKLRSYGLDGHETWEEDFSEFAQRPAFVAAPDASRFAMTRSWTAAQPGDINASSSAVATTLEEVRVYQNASGDMLAKVQLVPSFRTSENFDLSPDGRVLVAVNKDSIDVYALPELTKVDREDIAEVGKFAPASAAPATRVYFAELYQAGSEKAAETATAATKQVLTAPVTQTTAVAATPVGGADESWGDTQPTTGGRTRPTLLKPGEKPEFKDKTAPVQ